jgi:hypothetical protein
MDVKDLKGTGKLRLSTFSLKTNKVAKVDKESKASETSALLPIWDIPTLNDSNFAIGIFFVKKCIQWLRKTEGTLHCHRIILFFQFFFFSCRSFRC